MGFPYGTSEESAKLPEIATAQEDERTRESSASRRHEFDCAPWCAKASSFRREFKREVERYLTGKETKS